MNRYLKRSTQGICLALCLASGIATAEATDDAQRAREMAAWENFAEGIKRTGLRFLENSKSDDPVTRAEALKYLATQLSVAINITMAKHEPRPQMRLEMDDIRKMGLEASETKYSSARLQENGIYRFHGTLGNAAHIAVQLYTGMDAGSQAGAYLSGQDFQADQDGRFDVLISRTRPLDWKGPWLPLQPKTDLLFMREYFNDWDRATFSRTFIERLDEYSSTPLTGEQSEELLTAASRDFDGRLPIWIKLAENQKKKGDNVLSAEAVMPMGIGLADNRYGLGTFKLREDEAMLIELEPPESSFWSFQLGNYWWESLDYLNNLSSLTEQQSARGKDGKYRLIISARDPGYRNWLDTTGHGEGMIFYRFIHARGSAKIQSRVVRLADLADIIGNLSPRASLTERSEEIARRRAHGARRWVP